MPKPKASRSSRAPRSAEVRDEEVRENLQHLRELLADGVLLPVAALQETLDQAVRNGRMLRRDAEELTRGLVDSGRRQTQLVAGDLEQLLGLSGRDGLGTAARTVHDRASDGVRRGVDVARRAATRGGKAAAPTTAPIAALPIDGYDDLTVREITARLGALTPAQLRKLRDHESAGKARKGVLAAIERALA